MAKKHNDKVDTNSDFKNWFEKHQGLITFLGYLATVIIGGLSLYLSNSRSTEALRLSTQAFNLSNQQFNHQRIQDSLNDSTEAKSERESKIRFTHQDNVNEEQLNNFKSQTLIAKEQLDYFKKQTKIAETQLKNANLVYQNQLNENQPSFGMRMFKVDSVLHKQYLTLTFNFFNSGRRTAYFKRVCQFVWNPSNNLLEYENIPVGGNALAPSGEVGGSVIISEKLGLQIDNIVMFEIFYQDILSKNILTFRFFTRFNSFNPIVPVQVPEDVQNKFLSRITQSELTDRKKYLTYQ